LFVGIKATTNSSTRVFGKEKEKMEFHLDTAEIYIPDNTPDVQAQGLITPLLQRAEYAL
jgi:hypothetical protein